MKVVLLIALLISLLTGQVFANKTCSRTAVINGQEVLVDVGPTQKGEGLRYYLEKDDEALELLNEYQEANRPSQLISITSTTGSTMILLGLMNTNLTQGTISNSDLLLGGGLIIAVSYLVSKSMQYYNEDLLQNAVEQYNKRNSPQIYFTPYADEEGAVGGGLGLSARF